MLSWWNTERYIYRIVSIYGTGHGQTQKVELELECWKSFHNFMCETVNGLVFVIQAEPYIGITPGLASRKNSAPCIEVLWWLEDIQVLPNAMAARVYGSVQISVTKVYCPMLWGCGGSGVKCPDKKRYATLQWPSQHDPRIHGDLTFELVVPVLLP